MNRLWRQEQKQFIASKTNVDFINTTYHDLKYQIRLLNTNNFEVKGIDALNGFIKGIVAASGDNEYIFIDGIARITDTALSALESVFACIEKLEKEFNVKFILTCSAAKEDLPEFVLKHVE